MSATQKAGAAIAALFLLLGAGVFLLGERADRVVREADRRILTPTPAPVEEAAGPVEESEPVQRLPRARPGTLSISGRVLSPDGEPMGRVAVRALNAEGLQYSAMRTRPDGTFTLTNLDVNSAVFLEAEADDLALVPRQPEGGRVQLAEANVDGLEVKLMYPFEMTGTVVDSSGRPLPGVSVRAQRVGRFSSGESESRSDLHGGVRFRVNLGEYEFHFWGPRGDTALQPEPQRIMVSSAAELDGVVILCPDDVERRRVISGLVVDSNGKPVSHAAIHLNSDQEISGPAGSRIYSDSSYSGNDGAYTIIADENVATIYATHPYYSDSQRVTIEAASASGGEVPTQVTRMFDDHAMQVTQTIYASATTINLTMPSVASVRGRVVDARTGAPVRDFRVFTGAVSGEDDDYSIVHNDDGEFFRESVKAGNVAVWVAARGYADGYAPLGTVAPGEQRTNVEVRLTRGVELEGRVVDTSGRPVRLAQVQYLPAGGQKLLIRRLGSDVSNDDGYFMLPSVPLGPVTLETRHEKFVTKTTHLNVVPGTPEVRIVLEEGSRVVGHVTVGGKPATGMASTLSQTEPSKSVSIGPGGGFTLLGVAQGHATIHVMVNLQSQDAPATTVSITREVEVPEHGAAEFSVDLPKADAVIRGKVAPSERVPGGYQINGTYVAKTGQLVSCSSGLGNGGLFVMQVPRGPVRISIPTEKFRSSRLFLAEPSDELQTFRLDAGVTLTATFLSPRKGPARVMLVRGKFSGGQLPEIAQWQSMSSDLVATGFSRGEVVEILALEPGAYTLFASQLDLDRAVDEKNLIWTARQVEVGSEHISVEVNLAP